MTDGITCVSCLFFAGYGGRAVDPRENGGADALMNMANECAERLISTPSQFDRFVS